MTYTFDINFILSFLTYGTILLAVFIAMIKIPRIVLPSIFGLAIISNYTFDAEGWQIAFVFYIVVSTIVGIVLTLKHADDWQKLNADLYSVSVQRDSLLAQTNDLHNKLAKFEEKENKLKEANKRHEQEALDEDEFLNELRKMP